LAEQTSGALFLQKSAGRGYVKIGGREHRPRPVASAIFLRRHQQDRHVPLAVALAAADRPRAHKNFRRKTKPIAAKTHGKHKAEEK
jgi:hypothetical protein